MITKEQILYYALLAFSYEFFSNCFTKIKSVINNHSKMQLNDMYLWRYIKPSNKTTSLVLISPFLLIAKSWCLLKCFKKIEKEDIRFIFTKLNRVSFSSSSLSSTGISTFNSSNSILEMMLWCSVSLVNFRRVDGESTGTS